MRRAATILAALTIGCGGGGDDNDDADGGTPVPTAEAKKCLQSENFRVLGGRRKPDDLNAPDEELVASGNSAWAFLAFYKDPARAEKYAPQIADRTKDFDGSIERHGTLTIVWVRGRDGDGGKAIRDCALD